MADDDSCRFLNAPELENVSGRLFVFTLDIVFLYCWVNQMNYKFLQKPNP